MEAAAITPVVVYDTEMRERGEREREKRQDLKDWERQLENKQASKRVNRNNTKR